MMSKLSRTEKYLLILGFILSVIILARVYYLDLPKALTDQNAHLNFSRLIFDSLTPGISQIGFWPPLLHLLMSPFTLIPGFYNTGLASAIVLIPTLLLGMIFLYRTALYLTGREIFGILAAIIFITNPYILYYSTTPMMEMLFLTNLFGVTYFLTRWLQTQKLKYLLLSGIFVTLASLSRYEGLILIPVVGAVVLWELLRRRRAYSQIEATAILFGLLCFISVGYVLLYGLVFAGDPLAFMGGTWLKTTIVFATQNNFVQTVIYILHASFYMLGKPLVWISLISLPLALVISRQKSYKLSILLVLFSPILFVAMALYSGSYSIAVPELAPLGFFNNERYGLTWIGFAILCPLLLLHAIVSKFPILIRNYSKLISVTMIFIVSIFSVLQLYNAAFAQKLSIIKQNINVPLPQQLEISQYLLEHYDYGKILLTRADNDPILAQSNIPLRNYIYEGNYRFFDQSITQPWLFARWVVMYNPEETTDQWSLQNEKISQLWARSSEFSNFYNLILENETRRLYKINDEKLLTWAQQADYNIDAIPSINKNMEWWDPSKIYAQIYNQTSLGRTD